MNGNNVLKWLRGLRGKLMLILALPIVLLGVVIYFSLSGIGSQDTDIQKLVNVRLPVTAVTGQMSAGLHAIPRFLWVAYIHDGVHNAEKRSGFLANAKKYVQSFGEALDKYLSLPVIQKARDNMLPAKEHWAKMQEVSHQVITLLEKINPEMDRQARDLIMTEYLPRALKIGEILKVAEGIAVEYNAKIAKEASANSASVRNIVITASSVGVFIFLLLGVITAARTSKTLAEITQEIAASADQTATASNQLSGASQQLSSGATQAAASLEETVSSLEQLASKIKRNSQNANEASTLSKTSREAAEQGETEIKSLIEAMNEMASSSKKIEEIINVIDDIAFQTNLLALNAAVEAARAGDQGKGFAVVAEAVRNLAQRSASAAKEITGLIKDTVHKAERGSKMADNSGAALSKIVGAVQKVSALNNEISVASEEQAQGLAQINVAMSQLDTSTQSNAASAEEVAASSEEMSAQAQALHRHVAGLVNIIEGVEQLKERGVFSEVKSHQKAPSKVTPIRPAKANAEPMVHQQDDQRKAA